MTTTIIATKNAPDAIGPYVQGVDMGSFVFTSGQIPLCPETGAVAVCRLRRGRTRCTDAIARAQLPR